MVEAVNITSVLGYDDSVIPYCTFGIVGGVFSFILLLATVIVVAKAIEYHAEQKKNGTLSKLCDLFIVLCSIVLFAVISFAFSALFGSIGLL
ncbi:MAG: hypothetical protein E7353_09405 [Clostridiales bacterium]|nr:hypothetical protein [Clostridiales bacterium]